MTQEELIRLLSELRALPSETEWVEFKSNYVNPEEIGEYLSALANSASLHKKEAAYLVWGIEDTTHRVVGTDFKPRLDKVGVSRDSETHQSHLVCSKRTHENG